MTGLLVAAFSAGLLVGAATPPEDAAGAGRREFLSNCAVCHGVDARGDGPYAMFLRTAPTDLTRLAAENGGVFPYDRIFGTIDGRLDVLLHGPREMPVWGAEYNEAARERYAPVVGAEAVEGFVARRIQALIRYIESIQRE